MSPEQIDEVGKAMLVKGNMVACRGIKLFKDFYEKEVTVVKGRKVPIGTAGKVFWLGSYDNSKYGDPWGIYTTFRCGIKDSEDNVYWTSVDNIELIRN